MLDRLVKTWVVYDPTASGWISLQDVVFLICEIIEPLGKKNAYETEIKEEIKSKLEYIKAKGNIVDLSSKFLVNS